MATTKNKVFLWGYIDSFNEEMKDKWISSTQVFCIDNKKSVPYSIIA